MNKIISGIKNHKVASVIVLIVVVGGFYFWHKRAQSSTVKVQYVTAAVEKDTITAGVTGSGQVSEVDRVDIKPQGSGKLVSVNVKQGDTVKSGQIIAVIDQRTTSLAVSQAKAQLASAQASYDKLIAGETGASLQIDQAQLDAAKNALANAQTSYNNTVAQQKLAVDKAQTDMLNAGLAANPAVTNSSTATVTVTGNYTGTQQGQYNLQILSTGAGAYLTFNGLENGDPVKINRGFAQALGTMGLFVNFSTTGTLNSGDSWTITLPNTQSSSYLSAYNAYQSALQTQSQQITSAQEQIQSAQNNLDQAQAGFDQKIAPPQQSDVAAAQAQIQNAQAQLQSAEINYQNNIITAPFDGVVAQLNNNVGDQVGSADVVATVITNQQVAQLSLNEVDVSKVKVGQKAIMDFDAIDGLSLTGKVAEVDTIGTVTQGVVTYNVKVSFDTQDDRVKPGMSVNTTIITDVATDVLTVPNSAVKTQGGSTFVQVLDSSGKPQNKSVQVGISNDTLTEITSGLSEGDQIVTQTINPNTKTTSGSANAGGLRIPGLTGGGGAGFGGAGAARGN